MFPSNLPRPLRITAYAVAVGVVLYLCLAPTRDVPGADLLWDKAAHAIMWAGLTIAGFGLSTRRPRTIVIFALALGGGIEIMQALMGFGRQGDWHDFLADSIGVGVAALCYLLFQRWRVRK